MNVITSQMISKCVARKTVSGSGAILGKMRMRPSAILLRRPCSEHTMSALSLPKVPEYFNKYGPVSINKKGVYIDDKRQSV